MRTPRIEIDLSKIASNARFLSNLYGVKGITVTGVTKGVCGDPRIAAVFLQNGIKNLGDSRIANLRRLREAGFKETFFLLRAPALSEVEEAIEVADVSLNTEIEIIRKISKFALKRKKRHKIILMVELGDLREGILPRELEEVVEEVLLLEGVELSGIGTNLSCFGGVKPDRSKMEELSQLAQRIEERFELKLEYVSGGNSACYSWLISAENVGKINNIRLGDSILLGGKDLEIRGIPGLHYDAFVLYAEVIESKVKPSVPYGEIGIDAFGSVPKFEDRGNIRRVILNIGRQDVLVSQIRPRGNIEVLGATSDHMLLDASNTDLRVGDEVSFDIDYGAMLFAMSSPYVFKKYLNENEKGA